MAHVKVGLITLAVATLAPQHKLQKTQNLHNISRAFAEMPKTPTAV